MALKGQAKTDYQREYMRKRRSNKRSNESVRPITVNVRPKPERNYYISGELTKGRQVGKKGFNE